jgi:hypothetical protein
MRANHNDGRVELVYRALVSNQFVIDRVEPGPLYLRFHCHRFDEYGVSVRYLFVLCEAGLNRAASEAVAALAKLELANILVIGDGAHDLQFVTWDKFVSLCGGPIRSWLPFDPKFSDWLKRSGKNEEISELGGSADDVFEELVHLALQFILGDRVVRYGQARLFEKVPDGLAFAGSDVVILYDAKAYSDGYNVDAASVRQFTSYVNEFNAKYGFRIGRVFAFVVASGTFTNGTRSKANKRNDLYATCQTGLVFWTAQELGSCVDLLKSNPNIRNVLNWRRLLATPEITAKKLEDEATAIFEDGVVQR